jgi:5-(carboxyamino)imidazole ribonucleotide synthase
MMNPVLPGGTIGVLGGGQLGRMFAIAARQLGYRVHTLSPDTDTPAGQLADVEIQANYDDLDAIRGFVRDVDAVTFEFENVPADTLAVIEGLAPVRPRGEVLHITQNRLREKSFLQQHGFPVTPFRAVSSRAELDRALSELGAPAILKTASFGYDGKGQVRIDTLDAADDAFLSCGSTELILEAAIDFECELSVVAARGEDGAQADWGVIRNAHQRHILDVSTSPADLPDQLTQEAVKIAHSILEELNVIGVLCVEFFLRRDGRLLINELAPRPHNSGHLTIDASVTSQFEQQVRTVCGLPLGSTKMLRPAAMANLLGDVWERGTPRWHAALANPAIKLHLYGKSEARVGRKMGHLTALGDSTMEARQLVIESRRALMNP